MSIEAMKQALEALDIGLEYAESELYENRRRYEGYMHLAPDDQAYVNQIKEAIASLRQAIEQAEKQEPVAWNSGVPPLYPQIKDGETISVEYLETNPQPQQYDRMERGADNLDRMSKPNKRPLLKEWVGLTEEEIDEQQWVNSGGTFLDFARAIEAKLKEKNT
jgi:hypothetical protein